MYIAKYLRKISTFQLNFKYYKRILKASTLYKDRAKLKNSIIGLLLQALSWGKDMVAMSGSGPGYMQIIIITPYVHNMIYHVPQMMKKHGCLRKFGGQGIFINLYEQVHGTREIESPALPWHTKQMNT